MKDKLQEAAKLFIADQHYVNPMLQDACEDGIEFGANYASTQHKEEIEELQQQNNELREALKSAKRGNDSLKMIIDVLEAKNKELYDAVAHISRQNSYGYIKEYAIKVAKKHQPKK